MNQPTLVRGRKSNFRYQLVAVLVMLCSVLLSLSSANLHAQSTARITHTVTEQKKQFGPTLGRDLWFAMMPNFDVTAYYTLYLTSVVNTTVNVQIGTNAPTQYQVKAGQVTSIAPDKSYKVSTSGIVEPKAIHVWSNDADISAYLLEGRGFSSDGSYLIPTIGWGTEYVVASYEALFVGSVDEPSMFCVVANQDNTIIQVTPSADIRANA